MDQYKVVILGAGFVGIPTATVLALKNPHIQFVVYDINTARIQKCRKGEAPIYEPGLQQVMRQTIDKNLRFTTDISEALNNASVIFLALPTPTKNFGYKKGKAYDLSYTEVGIRSIVSFYNKNQMKNDVIIVEKSTVPIGTSNMLITLIEANSIQANKNRYTVASNPQFLAQGTAVNDLLNPERVIIGSKKTSNIAKLSNLFKFVGEDRLIFTNNASAELAKLASNCFLAQRVSSINSIAILCQEYDSDIKQVKKCIASDSRIGDKFLNSSIGFGGSCFKKDILALTYLAQQKGLHEVSAYWSQVIEMNEFRKENFFLRIYEQLTHNIRNKKICIFGTAFKKDTNDSRQSPAVQICNYLLLEGAILNIHDPKTKLQNFIEEIKLHDLWKEEFSSRLIEYEDAQKAVEGARAIVILTEWDLFKTYDYEKFYSTMEQPSHIFDGRNLLQEQKMQKLKFSYHRIGKKFNK